MRQKRKILGFVLALSMACSPLASVFANAESVNEDAVLAVYEEVASGSAVDDLASDSAVDDEASGSAVDDETSGSAVDDETSGSAIDDETSGSAVDDTPSGSAVDDETSGSALKFAFGSASGAAPSAESNNLTALDSAMILQKVLNGSYTMPIEELTDDYLTYLDVNADGQLTSADSATVLQKVLNSSFVMPVEEKYNSEK